MQTLKIVLGIRWNSKCFPWWFAIFYLYSWKPEYDILPKHYYWQSNRVMLIVFLNVDSYFKQENAKKGLKGHYTSEFTFIKSPTIRMSYSRKYSLRFHKRLISSIWSSCKMNQRSIHCKMWTNSLLMARSGSTEYWLCSYNKMTIQCLTTLLWPLDEHLR